MTLTPGGHREPRNAQGKQSLRRVAASTEVPRRPGKNRREPMGTATEWMFPPAPHAPTMNYPMRGGMREAHYGMQARNMFWCKVTCSGSEALCAVSLGLRRSYVSRRLSKSLSKIINHGLSQCSMQDSHNPGIIGYMEVPSESGSF